MQPAYGFEEGKAVCCSLVNESGRTTFCDNTIAFLGVVPLPLRALL
jgi:hypothetical protein